ncbi:MAG: cell division protein ZapA [Marinobacter sp.]
MPKPSTTVEVSILDKDYLVACPEEQQDALRRAARHLDGKMREIRTTGKVLGTERIAVMAALNITHELLEDSSMSGAADAILQAMDEKLDSALGNGHGGGDTGHTAGDRN